MLVLAARWQDNAYRQGLGQALRGVSMLHEDALRTLVQDYAHWDDTLVQGVDARDADWADRSVGAYVHRNYGISATLLIDAADEPIYAAVAAGRVPPGELAGLLDPLAPLIGAARANPMDSAQPHTAYLPIAGQVHLVAAAPVTAETPTAENMVRRPRPVLIYTRALDRAWVARLGAGLPMTEIAILDGTAVVAEDPLAIALTDPVGRPVAWLQARAVAPAGAAVSEVLPGLLAVFAAMGGLGAAVLAQERRAQRRYERHLLDLIGEAERANRAKSVFLAQMSHELRTPLNAVIGFAEVLKRQLSGDSRHVENVDHILSGGRHLLSLINEVLDLARIESGGFRIEEGDHDAGELLAQCVALMQPAAEAARVRLALLPLPAPAIALHVDDRALRQMLLNLLSNAVRYTRPGGTVTVRVDIGRDGTLGIAVEDDGIGIPGEELALVRQPFERSSLARQRSGGGMGLGLSIVTALIALHGGRLDLSSEPGAGTTATLILPAERVAATARAPAA